LSHTDNVLVIGGAGFIGRRLVARLTDGGHAVTVASRSAGARQGEDPRVVYRTANVADADRVSGLAEGMTVVYDLSMGAPSRWEDYEREVIGGAVNVARACLRHGVRRLIYTSTISAIDLGGKGAVDETSPNVGNSPNRGMYARGKALAERALVGLHAAERLPVVIFRPGLVLGPGGKLVHGGLGERASDTCVLGWGPGTYPLPCVLVDDVAQALVSAKDAPGVEGLTFNLAGDVRPTAAEYVQELRRRALRNFRFYPRRLWAMQGGELARWGVKTLARKPNVVLEPPGDMKSLTMSAPLDCSLAKRLLGWTPCADREEFFRQAIDPHLKPIPAGDLRREPVA